MGQSEYVTRSIIPNSVVDLERKTLLFQLRNHHDERRRRLFNRTAEEIKRGHISRVVNIGRVVQQKVINCSDVV